MAAAKVKKKEKTLLRCASPRLPPHGRKEEAQSGRQAASNGGRLVVVDARNCIFELQSMKKKKKCRRVEEKKKATKWPSPTTFQNIDLYYQTLSIAWGSSSSAFVKKTDLLVSSFIGTARVCDRCRCTPKCLIAIGHWIFGFPQKMSNTQTFGKKRSLFFNRYDETPNFRFFLFIAEKKQSRQQRRW